MVVLIGCSLASPGAALAEHDQPAPQPGNDYCSQSSVISPSQTYEGQTNIGATGSQCPQPVEISACDGILFGHTVWYLVDIPAKGTFTVSTSGASNLRTDPSNSSIFLALDTMLGLYTQTQYLTCNDDGNPSVFGGSAITREVQAGRHFVQVGGAEYTAIGGPDTGYFTLRTAFTADPDRDDDGASPPSDCDDDNPARKPGLPDVGVNGIDDDCDQVIDPDKDSDNYKARPHGRDCNDTPGIGAGINPGAPEIRGNKVDENCDRKKSPFRQINADVDYSTNRFSWGIVITSPVKLTGVPRGARSTVLCFKPNGKPCGRFGPTRKRSFPQLRGRRLASKTVLIIYVSKPRHIGRYIKIRVRGGTRRPETTVRCTNPGSSKPRKLGRCPGRR